MKPKINNKNKEIVLKDLGIRIQEIRKEKKISQLELAVRCNSDRRKIGGTERGEYDFRITSLMILAKGLDTDVQNLLNTELMNELKKDIWK